VINLAAEDHQHGCWTLANKQALADGVLDRARQRRFRRRRQAF
jgi:hypothetical protein